MPTYAFECQKCKNKYDFFVRSMKLEDKEIKCKCPKCNSTRKKRCICVPSFSFNQPEGTDRWNGDHGYRFNHRLPQAAEQREKAKKKSHMGTDPYNKIDDIRSGKHFGEVK